MKNKLTKSVILTVVALVVITALIVMTRGIQTRNKQMKPSGEELPFWTWTKANPKKEAKADALINQVIEKGPFTSSWESLRQYKVPEWFRDAKFGIFVHWGPATLEFEGKADATDGGNTDYRSRAMRFKGEKFDASYWAKLIRNAGAKYVVQVVEHHDAYAMYDAAFTPWSSVKMAPKRDFARELSDAARKEGLIYGASSHTEEHWWFYSQPPKKAPPAPQADRPVPPQPDKAFLDTWIRRLSDIVEKYQPRIFWFDWVIEQPSYEPYLQKFAAYYYNWAKEQNQEVVLNYKYKAFPAEAAVQNISVFTGPRAGWEPRGAKALPWQFDTMSSQAWFWKPDIQTRPVADIIGEMADVVSKNGNYMLNLTPAPDGTPGPEQELLVQELGHWMEMNGEAIYGTRPWILSGEGPAPGMNPSFRGVTPETPYTSQDIRFTRKGEVLYALVLAVPRENISIASLGKSSPASTKTIRMVELLGSSEKLTWKQKDDALVIEKPLKMPCDYAITFRIGFTQ